MLRDKKLVNGSWWSPTEEHCAHDLAFEELLDLSRVVLDPRALLANDLNERKEE